MYRNPSSRLGGVRFFREPPTEATAVFEIIDTSGAATARQSDAASLSSKSSWN
jgi:hypothetical protein